MKASILKAVLCLLGIVVLLALLITWGSGPSPEQKWVAERDRKANGTVGNTADGKFDETTTVAIKAPSAWNGGYGAMIEPPRQSEKVVLLETFIEMSIQLVNAQTEIEALKKENNILRVRLGEDSLDGMY